MKQLLNILLGESPEFLLLVEGLLKNSAEGWRDQQRICKHVADGDLHLQILFLLDLIYSQDVSKNSLEETSDLGRHALMVSNITKHLRSLEDDLHNLYEVSDLERSTLQTCVLVPLS